jgi:hypothetical protein
MHVLQELNIPPLQIPPATASDTQPAGAPEASPPSTSQSDASTLGGAGNNADAEAPADVEMPSNQPSPSTQSSNASGPVYSRESGRESHAKDGGLGAGAISGIAASVVVLLILANIMICFAFHHRKMARAADRPGAKANGRLSEAVRFHVRVQVTGGCCTEAEHLPCVVTGAYTCQRCMIVLQVQASVLVPECEILTAHSLPSLSVN